MPPDPSTHPKNSYLQRLKHLGYFILLLWLIELADQLLLQNSLENHGIHPRSLSQLPNLLFAPFLHADWSHLLGNSLSLLALGAAILTQGWRNLILVSTTSALLAGLLAWLIGASGTNHLGASSLVFGYLSFLLASGFYQRTPRNIIISSLVGLFYGGSLLSILPRNSDISWESHLGGAIAGLLIARHQGKKHLNEIRTSSGPLTP